MKSSFLILGESMSVDASTECSDDTDAGGVGRYSVTAVRKLEPILSSKGGVSGALVIST